MNNEQIMRIREDMERAAARRYSRIMSSHFSCRL